MGWALARPARWSTGAMRGAEAVVSNRGRSGTWRDAEDGQSRRRWTWRSPVGRRGDLEPGTRPGCGDPPDLAETVTNGAWTRGSGDAGKSEGGRSGARRGLPAGLLRRGGEEAGIHREASMALVCSCLNRERGREVRGIHRRRRKREEGDGRERDDLVVVTNDEGNFGGGAACGRTGQGRGDADRQRRSCTGLRRRGGLARDLARRGRWRPACSAGARWTDEDAGKRSGPAGRLRTTRATMAGEGWWRGAR